MEEEREEKLQTEEVMFREFHDNDARKVEENEVKVMLILLGFCILILLLLSLLLPLSLS